MSMYSKRGQKKPKSEHSCVLVMLRLVSEMRVVLKER